MRCCRAPTDPSATIAAGKMKPAGPDYGPREQWTGRQALEVFVLLSRCAHSALRSWDVETTLPLPVLYPAVRERGTQSASPVVNVRRGQRNWKKCSSLSG